MAREIADSGELALKKEERSFERAVSVEQRKILIAPTRLEGFSFLEGLSS
jgi:hypothetical protein